MSRSWVTRSSPSCHTWPPRLCMALYGFVDLGWHSRTQQDAGDLGKIMGKHGTIHYTCKNPHDFIYGDMLSTIMMILYMEVYGCKNHPQSGYFPAALRLIARHQKSLVVHRSLGVLGSDTSKLKAPRHCVRCAASPNGAAMDLLSTIVSNKTYPS